MDNGEKIAPRIKRIFIIAISKYSLPCDKQDANNIHHSYTVEQHIFAHREIPIIINDPTVISGTSSS